MKTFNDEMAGLFRLAADLLETQRADWFRIRAYRRAADAIEELDEPASEIYRKEGLSALIALPSIGKGVALAIADVVEVGHWRWLERLQGSVDPERVLATVAGVGPGLAGAIHHELGIETLEELECAAHDGRLARVPGFGAKRIQSVRDSLAGRLGTGRRSSSRDDDRTGARSEQSHQHRSHEESRPTMAELLDVDDEYRREADRRALPLITPRRFNPTAEAWLPVLHTIRGGRHLTAMYSNTARAHQLGHTNDWVVIYADAPDQGRWTVVTETRGPRKGQRVVRWFVTPSPHESPKSPDSGLCNPPSR